MKQIGYTMAGHVIETTDKLMKAKLGDTDAAGAFPLSHCLPWQCIARMAIRRRRFTANQTEQFWPCKPCSCLPGRTVAALLGM